jgi:predicted TIM-barrel fold metal-dependent hydrolase
MPVVDTHFHLWKLGHGRYPWLEGPPIKTHFGDYSGIRRDYLPADYLDDTAGCEVVQSVHVQAEWDAADPVGETRWLQEQASRNGLPTAVVANADLAAADVESTLDRHMAFPFVRGIRMLLRKPDQLAAGTGNMDILADPAWRRGFALLAPRGLVYDLQATSATMRSAAALARDFPQTTIVLTHCGLPLDRSEAGREDWRAGIAELARCPNVVAKISGLGMLDRGLDAAVLRPIVHFVLESFGPQRCMFGSNFPVDGLMGRYPDLLGLVRRLVAEWHEAALPAVLHGTAQRVYRL